MDWPTLEHGDEHEKSTPDTRQGKRSPEQSLRSRRREDALVEADHRKLDERGVEKVQAGHDVEVHEHFGDGVWLQGPYVPPQAVRRQAVHVDEGARDARDHSDEDEPIVQAERHLCHVQLGREPNDHEQASNTSHRGRRRDQIG